MELFIQSKSIKSKRIKRKTISEYKFNDLKFILQGSIRKDFDEDGKILKEIDTRFYDHSGICKNILCYFYDGKHRLYKKEEYGTNERVSGEKEKYEGTSFYIYDENNNMVEKQFIKSDNSRYVNNSKSIYEYDDDSRETKKTDFDLPTTDLNRYVFSQSVTRKYKGENLIEYFVYRRGPLRLVKPMGVDIGEENEEINCSGGNIYEYDKDGKFVRLYFLEYPNSDKKRLEYSLQYDDNGNVIEMVCDPDDEIIKYRYKYDSIGNLIERHWISEESYDDYKDLYKYDEYNNVIEKLHGVIFDDGKNIFINKEKKVTEYEYY